VFTAAKMSNAASVWKKIKKAYEGRFASELSSGRKGLQE
jgi:hypothetical protein